MKRYSTYLFDVGGTLIHFDNEKRASVYAERAGAVGVNITPGQVRSVLDALELEIPERQGDLKLSLDPVAARKYWGEFIAEGYRRLGVDDESSQILAREMLASREHFQILFPDVTPALDALQAQGVRFGIVSNFSSNCEELLAEVGLAKYFDFFIVSGIFGAEKPDPRIFQAAIAAADKPTGELVYVGDSLYHDVFGARTAGLDAILLDRTNRHPEFDGARVATLLELPDLVSQS